MKVLVTGAGALLGQGIIKSLRMPSLQYEIIAVDPDPRSVGLYWADRSYLIPLATDPAYLNRIRSILAAERPDAVLIGTDVELMVFAENRSALEAEFNTKIIVCSPEVVAIADDKWLTYQFLKDNSFPHPKSALPDGLPDLLRECDFPLVVKPRVGARSMGVHVVKTEAELQAALTEVPNAVIQESVATNEDEYTSGIVLSDGSPKAIVTMRRDLRDGNTYRAYVQPHSPFDETLLQIATRLGGLGSINFQYRSDRGTPKIFEINARFSGTTPFRAAAGYNEVDAVLRHFVLGEPIPLPALRPITILRYWEEIVIEPESVAELATGRGPLQPHYTKPGLL
jgi:carbamoyl-phosphate synthase large subunit